MGWKRALWPEWTVDSHLGSGSFGHVYKIRRTDIGGTYYAALKVISIPSGEEAEKFTYPTDGLKGGSAYSNDFGTWSTISSDRLEETHWFWANTDYGKDVQQVGATWFRVQIRWDDRVVEEFVVQEGDHVGP